MPDPALTPTKKARKIEPAQRAVISRYLDAVLSRSGALLVRGGEAYWINDDEMDRLANEWLEFRSMPLE